MAYKNRFFKNTLGVDAQVFVPKAVEYTNDTTLQDFVANAVEGELAVVNASTGAVLTSAPAAGTLVFFALKRDGNVETSTPFKTGSSFVEASVIAYDAPVKQISTISNAGVIDTLVLADITYYADEIGDSGITIQYANTATAGAETVTVTGTAVVVGIETAVSTATQVLAALNASSAFLAIASAAITGTASNAQVTTAATPLAGGNDSYEGFSKGDYAEIVLVETTPGLEPLPRWGYSVNALAGESYAELMARLVAKINSATSAENLNKTRIVTAALTAANNITLTAIDFNVHFTVVLRGIFSDAGATVSTTTPFSIGSGTPEQAELAELYGDIRKGVQTQYPEQNATNEEFGKATSFVSTSNTYATFKFKFTSEDPTRTLGKEFRQNYIIVYSPSNGSNPTSELTTIFGL